MAVRQRSNIPRSFTCAEPVRGSEKICGIASGFVGEALAADVEMLDPVNPEHPEGEFRFAPPTERPGAAEVAQAQGAHAPLDHQAIASAGYGYVPVAPMGPVVLTGGIGASPQRQPLAIFYVKVADPAATLKRAEALGARVVLPPFEVPGGIIFGRFAYPEGNVVGVVRRPN